MKNLSLLLLLVAMTSIAQIRGNKTIETRTYKAKGIESIKTNLYAKITIDQSLSEGLTITADSNLFDYIGKTVENGELHIDQLELISPSQDIIITVGAPKLRRLEQGTHDTTQIINLNADYLQVMAPLGHIILQGQTKELRLGSELATIDASKVKARDVFVNLWSYGNIIIDPQESLWAEVSNDGTLLYLNKPQKFQVRAKNGGQVLAYGDKDKAKTLEAEYITFKIKNNSNNRNQFYVEGPKPDGSKFSYGFPMMPYSKRNEKWTVGTKVYKVNSLGFKKLLVEIKKENENSIINLF
ncbi:DUF2807 domain-containing protein [Winogradskyella sp. DF17]|uniref:DUF2807 domain-containing protein n=1 Tax=Winogradskyella pelagia TaxID=2819984 RepID=A0ABS3T127_9FLAO|nr:DUF2807 domain-containing protein [Winogradskyella sp. DF17]MBO3116450.1 DUF2807 domain-containing protein [Winogradskyella sp. DF17]